MRTPPAVVSAAIVLMGGLTGCSSASVADMAVGDCLKMGGTPDRPEATKVECGSPESNFNSFSDAGNTICMDIDWVVGGCMSIDPENDKDPLRVDCNDNSVPNRQRATQILKNVASVDQCVSGVGYPYDERDFTVCVEDVS